MKFCQICDMSIPKDRREKIFDPSAKRQMYRNVKGYGNCTVCYRRLLCLKCLRNHIHGLRRMI